MISHPSPFKPPSSRQKHYPQPPPARAPCLSTISLTDGKWPKKPGSLSTCTHAAALALKSALLFHQPLGPEFFSSISVNNLEYISDQCPPHPFLFSIHPSLYTILISLSSTRPHHRDRLLSVYCDMADEGLMQVCVVGSNAVSAFLSWRLQASNACDVTVVWKQNHPHVAQYGLSFKSVTISNWPRGSIT